MEASLWLAWGRSQLHGPLQLLTGPKVGACHLSALGVVQDRGGVVCARQREEAQRRLRQLQARRLGLNRRSQQEGSEAATSESQQQPETSQPMTASVVRHSACAHYY